jgi:transposase
MALGRRRPKQQDLFIATQDLPTAPGHAFYDRLNRLLAEAGFDAFVEQLCAPYYAEALGRPSIPPSSYFRMLFIGYFEGLDSQRGIAWRCADSRSLQAFLGYLPTESTPDHSSLTRVRQRLPEAVHEQVFAFVLGIAHRHGLLAGKTLAVDSTLLEANAAMKSIVRKDTGEDWKAYLTRLAQAAGITEPTAEDLRRFDRQRQDKKVSNDEWHSPTDPDSRIAKLKDGTTHLAYKAEHAVDLESNLVVAAQVYPTDRGDAQTLVPTLLEAQINLVRAGSDTEVSEVVADKGYHAAETLAECARWQVRTYIPEKRLPHRRQWADKPAAWAEAYRANRRRVRGARSKRLQRQRSERVERSFAHSCETGGARRSWLRGLVNVTKRYLIHVAALNLGVVLRRLFGIGTPRSLQGAAAALCAWFFALVAWCHGVVTDWRCEVTCRQHPDHSLKAA